MARGRPRKQGKRHKCGKLKVPAQPNVVRPSEWVSDQVHRFGQDYNSAFGRNVRNIVAEPEFNQVFPNVTLAADSKAAGRMNTNHGGAYVAAGAVHLSDKALAILERQPRNSDWPFPAYDRKTGHPHPYKQASTNWQDAKKRARKAAQKGKWKYTPFSLHALRHIYAIEYLVNGGNLYALQRQLGHGTIKQTEEYLQYLTPEEAMHAQTSVGTPSDTTHTGFSEQNKLDS